MYVCVECVTHFVCQDSGENIYIWYGKKAENLLSFLSEEVANDIASTERHAQVIFPLVFLSLSLILSRLLMFLYLFICFRVGFHRMNHTFA